MRWEGHHTAPGVPRVRWQLLKNADCCNTGTWGGYFTQLPWQGMLSRQSSAWMHGRVETGRALQWCGDGLSFWQNGTFLPAQQRASDPGSAWFAPVLFYSRTQRWGEHSQHLIWQVCSNNSAEPSPGKTITTGATWLCTELDSAMLWSKPEPQRGALVCTECSHLQMGGNAELY